MTIHLVDESDTRLGILVSTRNNSVPNIRREDHSRSWRFFDRAARQIGGEKCSAIAESHCRSVRCAIEHVFIIANGIVNRFSPRLAIELQLKPLVVIDRFQK